MEAPMSPDPMTRDLPGGELPSPVYRSIVLAFAWMLLASWIAFASGAETDLVLTVAAVLFAVFLGLPLLIHATAAHHTEAKPETLQHFLTSSVDTATGPLSGREAWLEIALIPAALALAATLIGLVFILEH
jgi:hypothetical protein